MMENENLLKKRADERYKKLSDDIQKELDNLVNHWEEREQLQVIKRKRKYPDIGDVFLVNPRPGLYFWGVVLDNNVKHPFGDNLLVVMIFKEKITSLENLQFEVNLNNILLAPTIVGPEYWSRGYFFTISHMDYSKNDLEYGFYSVAFDEIYDKHFNIVNEPFDILQHYGATTSIGIAQFIRKELVIDKSLAECDETLKLI